MKKQSLIDYLDDGVQNLDFDGTLAWNWLKHERAFELEMEFYVENQSGHKKSLIRMIRNPLSQSSRLMMRFYCMTKLNHLILIRKIIW